PPNRPAARAGPALLLTPIRPVLRRRALTGGNVRATTRSLAGSVRLQPDPTGSEGFLRAFASSWQACRVAHTGTDMMRRLLSGPLTAFAATILSAVSVAAQTNIESNAGIQLDFVNPGARSLALGGAFVGLADDATASFTNPAGLRFISRKEVSAEGRHWSF